MNLRTLTLLVTLSASTAWPSTYKFASLEVGATDGDYGYRFVGRPHTKDFVLEAAVKTTAAGPAVRIVFGFQDPLNFYFAEASDTACLFVKVENGIQKRIGTPSTAILPREASVTATVIRWRSQMGLWLDGLLVAEAYDGAWSSGSVGVSARKDSAAVESVRFQMVADVRLADDFMRTGAEETVWEPVAGTWKLKALPSASLSANAFMFEGKAAEAGKPALAVRGHWFWSGYTASAAVKPADDEAVGLVFYYRGPASYHLLRWESAAKGGRLQLLRVAGDQRQVLAETARGFAKGQWYELSVRTFGRRLTACVDGNPLLDTVDPRLVCGSIGLYAESTEGAVFDDVDVAAPRSFEEDFEREMTGKWLELGGSWQRQPGRLLRGSGEGAVLVASAQAEGRCVSGEDDWEDYAVAADLLAPTRGDVGLVAHYQDETNYYLFRLSPAAASLVRVVESERTELAQAPCSVPLGSVHRLGFSVERGVLTGSLDGRVLVRRCDLALRNGRAGLYVAGGAEAAFDNLAVAFPQRSHPLFTAHDVFAAETSMENWAVRQSDWLAAEEKLDGQALHLQWHRADFPGEVELEAKLKSLPAGGALWLALGCEGQTMASGYAVCLDHPKDSWRLRVMRLGKLVAEQDAALKGAPGRLSAERVGHALVAHLDGKVALTYEDPQPLDGRRIGWAIAGGELATNGIEIFSRSVTVYAFHNAPVDWRPVGGDWEVTNRWACDPRWSFFAGQLTPGDSLVAMWNKRQFGPDVTVEFAAGIRHDPDRGGTAYGYASDINAVICGDGADLTKGYNVVFGGWNNEFTRILRDGKPVAETKDFRFPRDSSQHRQWFYFKVQKQGSHVRLYVDNQLALDYNDPQPLAGRRVALWTWNNGLMVARVRVSAAGDAPCEPPVAPTPEKPHCIYR